MKLHTTNYYNTFIATADDCSAIKGELPAVKGDEKTIAALQFEMISQHPYRFTSDDVVFSIFARRNDLTANELERARENFFSKGQACLRTSALAKRYGWGLHFDAQGNVALYGCETEAYQNYLTQDGIAVVKAIRSKRRSRKLY